jgi:hypothetical protein
MKTTQTNQRQAKKKTNPFYIFILIATWFFLNIKMKREAENGKV